jgi:hypothetical protein
MITTQRTSFIFEKSVLDAAKENLAAEGLTPSEFVRRAIELAARGDVSFVQDVQSKVKRGGVNIYNRVRRTQKESRD